MLAHRTLMAALAVSCLCIVSGAAVAQDEFEDEPIDSLGATSAGTGELVKGWEGASRVLRVPGATGVSPEERAAAEIFPDARKVWMHVSGVDPRPIEAARRGASDWICARGCEMSSEDAPGQAPIGDRMLRSIKVQTPTMPLPLTIWRPRSRNTGNKGELLFDPVLLGRRDYDHVHAYPPVSATRAAGTIDDIPALGQGQRKLPTPDSAEMFLGMQWPAASEMADFQYLAVTDSCGNARVMPFQRAFTVPVFHVASGGCGKADGTILRVFPAGTWLRVTAFNLDAPAAGNVVSATFRVTVPPLEDLVSDDTPPLLFPDPKIDDLMIDCGPVVLKARRGPGGVPRQPGDPLPGQSAPPGQTAPPGKALPGQTPPPGKALPGQTPPPGKVAPGAAPVDGPDKNAPGPTKPTPPIVRPQIMPASAPQGQPLAHQHLIIAPEPLWQGNCRIELTGQTKRRLVAPLALRVRVTRTDDAKEIALGPLLDQPWIVTPTDHTFRLPPLGERMDGESRLRIEVYSDPQSPNGNVVLLSDAGRIERVVTGDGERSYKRGELDLERLIGSVTVHTAPLCGDTNFETTEGAGSCLRGYFTVPAMLATLQVTRAPWVERPLITRSVLSAVGIAFAFDSYDPVERRAFPIAGHVGGFVQDLGDDRLGLLAYVGVAPTVPILGEGGNTTSIGVLGGLGIEYITRTNGPDEGFKPAAFLSVIVQIGQANPSANAGGQAFGSYAPPPGGYGY
jgi:hypothetical protein